MEKKKRIWVIGWVLVVLLAGCQAPARFSQGTLNNSTSGVTPASGLKVSPSEMVAATTQAAGILATPTVEPDAQQTLTPTVTTDPAIQGAIQGAQAYFAALESRDFSGGANLVSAHSLKVMDLTNGDVVDLLTNQSLAGSAWSDLEIGEVQRFDSKTVLIPVTYTLGSVDPASQEEVQTKVKETWAMRLEGGKWMFNWDHLIDTKYLDVEPQTNGGITAEPKIMVRYTDRISLGLMVQNVSGKDVYFGYATQTLATFYFGIENVDAANVMTVIQNNQTTLNYTIDVYGLFNTYPVSVEIIKYPAYPDYSPMFTFTLAG
jgi:hypothetical protein